MSTPLRYSLLAISMAALICALVVLRLGASAAVEVPHVEFNADNVGPRDIEDLTSQSVPRDYGFAWQTMAQALDENRPALLDGYFTGLARQDLRDRVNAQLKSGLRTHYEDRGHKLEAIFYAPGGDAMQLRDHVQLDVQILDGGKVIYEEPLSAEYMVLMTPGADRWLVRQIQALPSEKR
jgi:hypothetical protein